MGSLYGEASLWDEAAEAYSRIPGVAGDWHYHATALLASRSPTMAGPGFLAPVFRAYRSAPATTTHRPPDAAERVPYPALPAASAAAHVRLGKRRVAQQEDRAVGEHHCRDDPGERARHAQAAREPDRPARRDHAQAGHRSGRRR